jgi:hypothetical protein
MQMPMQLSDADLATLQLVLIASLALSAVIALAYFECWREDGFKIWS